MIRIKKKPKKPDKKSEMVDILVEYGYFYGSFRSLINGTYKYIEENNLSEKYLIPSISEELKLEDIFLEVDSAGYDDESTTITLSADLKYNEKELARQDEAYQKELKTWTQWYTKNKDLIEKQEQEKLLKATERKEKEEKANRALEVKRLENLRKEITKLEKKLK